jgi:hypothetical protein
MAAIDLFEMSWKDYLEIKGFNKQKEETMAETCRKCREDQLKKHKKITIKCTGERTIEHEFTQKYGEKTAKAVLAHLQDDPTEMLQASSAYNPYDFMRANITDPKLFNPRWYQEKAVLCSATKKVLRMGRRCIAKDELVLMADYSYKKIQDIEPGDYVISNKYDKATTQIVTHKYNNGVQPVYEVLTEKNHKVRLTEDHEILTKRGWVTIAQGLSNVDYISTLASKESTDYEYLRVKSITPIGLQEVYDITVPGTNNFTVEGLTVHNCGKTYSMVVGMLHNLLTKPGYTVLIAAPQITMIDEIVSACEEICRQLKTEYPIVRNSSSPIIEIEFNNGSIIKGVTTANDAKSARGKSADLIWLEEADFIEKKALNSILGVLADRSDIELWVSSTPIGERNLYSLAQRPDIREFHYPTFVVPHYESENLDEFFRGAMTQSGYVQEVMAEYGVDVDSVFQIMFIEESTELERDPYYSVESVLANRQDFIVFIGVDWNHDKVGTRIVVTAYSRSRNILFIVKKEKVSSVGWTQALAVESIVNLNRLFAADHIYVDEGFGIGQVTELRKKGVEAYGKVANDHPDLKLEQTVSVQFGSSIKIHDPITGEVYSKRVKQYMVENLSNTLEKKSLYFSSVEDNDIIMQMKNYLIKNVSVNGAKSYSFRDKQIADHDLDAFMLTIYAFNVEYGDYIRPQSLEYAAGFGKELLEPALKMDSLYDAIGVYVSRTSKSKFKPKRKW